ncbi:MAG: RagB/SusD family nutrient uptake outer membrane protein [Marinilabiliales bacterium]|nr:RagB/SusD family nutrient uptake outer membrane protein [Marinilabiliales bacterium]
MQIKLPRHYWMPMDLAWWTRKPPKAKNWEKMFVTPKTIEAVMTVPDNTVTTVHPIKRTMAGNSRPVRRRSREVAALALLRKCWICSPWPTGKNRARAASPDDPLKFYKDRDPRFYRTFAFNGCVWLHQASTAYPVWTYQWFKDQAAVTGAVTKEGSGFAEYAGHVLTGIYVRKRSDPRCRIHRNRQICPFRFTVYRDQICRSSVLNPRGIRSRYQQIG